VFVLGKKSDFMEFVEVVAYTMEYNGATVDSELALVPFEEKYYEDYRDIYHDCFYEMRKALGLRPYNACDSIKKLLAKKNDVFLLLADNEIVASVAVYENEIDDLFVSRKFQGRGYGKKLLQFAVSLLQKRNVSPIALNVAEWNQKAISLYKNNGFVVSKIETVSVKQKPEV